MVYGKLSEILKEKGIKQRVVARHIGITDSLMSQYLTGKVTLPADVFAKICEFIGVSMDDVLQNKETES